MDMKHSPAHQGPGTPREDNGGDMNNYSMTGPPYQDGPPPPPNVSLKCDHEVPQQHDNKNCVTADFI